MGKMDEMLVEEVVNSMEDLKTEAIAIQKLAQRSCVTFMLHDFGNQILFEDEENCGKI